MITEYSNSSYRITYESIAMIENALGFPNLIQISVSSECRIIVAKNTDYGIDYLPNGEYRSWKLSGVNTKLNRAGEHYIYARLLRDGDSGLIVFSVNDYAIDGSISGQNPSQSYYYFKIGKITATDSPDNDATVKREITIDYGFLSTPAASEGTYSEWKDLFEVTSDNLIRPLKRFTSYIVQGTLSIIGKFVLNEKQISDIAKEGDQDEMKENYE